MKPTWRALQAVSLLADMCVISSPDTEIVPAEGTSSPPSKFSNVVLPDPLGPINATKSPLSTSRFRPWRTWISSPPRAYFLSRPRTWIKLAGLPFPSTLTMMHSSLFDLDDLTVAQIFRNLRHQRISLGYACQNFDVLSPLGAESHGAAFHFAVVNQEYSRSSILLTHRRARDQSFRRGYSTSHSGAGLLFVQKRNLD